MLLPKYSRISIFLADVDNQDDVKAFQLTSLMSLHWSEILNLRKKGGKQTADYYLFSKGWYFFKEYLNLEEVYLFFHELLS